MWKKYIYIYSIISCFVVPCLSCASLAGLHARLLHSGHDGRVLKVITIYEYYKVKKSTNEAGALGDSQARGGGGRRKMLRGDR